MSKDKTTSKRPSLIGFAIVSLIWLGLCVTASGWYWGIFGKIGKTRTTVIFYSLIPSQKQALADELNFHYRNTLLRKYTKGVVLSCEPNVDSIRKQFNWFHRNTVSSQLSDMPDYHTIVTETLQTLNRGAVVPIKNPSTSELEYSLMNYSRHKDAEYTEKDERSDFLTKLGLGVKYSIGAALPEASLAISTVGIVHDMLPDSEKLVPAIICLQKIRLTNWLYTAAGLWLIIMLLYIKRIFKRK